MSPKTFSVADAHRLDDPERLKWLPPGEIVAALDLKPGEAVADIGAGTGYFSLPMARVVGTDGRVYAVDFQTGMLDILGQKLLEPRAPTNVVPVHGSAERTTLPGACADIVLMSNVWHEVENHGPMLREVARVLRSHGRFAVLDWRADCPPPPGPPADHRISSESVEKALRENGFPVERSGHVGKYGYLVISRKRS